MFYFDYSATSPTDEEILNEFLNNTDNKNININDEKKKIQKLLNTNLDVIYTSGSTESNNLAIKGILLKYINDGKKHHIITTELEHSSIIEQMKYFSNKNFIIDYVNLKDGIVDLDSLKSLITEDTVLVSICSVNSETGVLQPIDEIGKILKDYPNIVFHSDMTQSMGKVNVKLDNVDLVSFSAHKFYGIKGIGCLLKRKNLKLEKIVFGNKKLPLGLINSLGNALEKVLKDLDKKYNYVLELSNMLKNSIKDFPNITINSNEHSIPHILNISVNNYKPETFLHTLELYGIYISTKSACSSKEPFSKAVYAVTNDMDKAKTSIRISISFHTKKEDILFLIKVLTNLK